MCYQVDELVGQEVEILEQPIMEEMQIAFEVSESAIVEADSTDKDKQDSETPSTGQLRKELVHEETIVEVKLPRVRLRLWRQRIPNRA